MKREFNNADETKEKSPGNLPRKKIGGKSRHARRTVTPYSSMIKINFTFVIF